MDVKNCEFINNTATKGAGIMVGGINHPKGIDGDNSHGHNITVENCIFTNNNASLEGGAVHISGDNNSIINSQFYFNEAHEGGAVHITGDNSLAKDCYFDDNLAVGGNGSAIFVHGDNASVIDSEFYNHQSSRGTVFIRGDHATVEDSTFEHNIASRGGAGVYVDGNYTYMDGNTFKDNNATIHGGAIHSHGDHVKILNSFFYDNHATPHIENKDQGLGGAIYIRGDHNEISFSTFEGNTARNGSAIYNKGLNLTLNDDYFHNNQAFSYLLFTVIKPNATSYYNESANTVVEITHIGGDNIINAIHNAGSILDIFFHNVTYYHSEGVHKTGADEIHPVDGVENSQGATILYQDDREDLQVIDVIVTNDESGEEIFNSLGKELRTGLYGNLTVVLRQGLRPGNYTVNATHPDDKNYTSITNITQFRILPHIDVSVTKTSDKDVYVLGEEAIFTIRVYGVGTNATNVKVKDFLPESFKFVSAVTTNGSYDNASNVWDIGFLPHGASATLTLKVKTTELGTFDNVVNVTCKEKDWDLTNNVDNKTIKVNIYYTKSASVTNISAGEYFEYYLDVHNVGDTVYTDTLLVRDVLPEGIFYTGEYNLTGADLVEYVNYVKIQIWNITNISPGITARITVKVKALKDGVWNNTMYVGNLPPVNATVNVSSSADVLIIKEVSDLKTNNGDLINWTVIVKNEGPSIAMDVCVVDVIPKGVEIFGITNATKGNYNRNNAQWFIGDMAVGETQTLIITTRVMLSNVNITNEATVNSTTPDPNPDNNYDNATTEVSPEGDVGVEKTVSSHEVNHGQVIYWTIVVTNHGPDKATGVFVTDALPGGLEYINSTKSKGKDYNPISGNWYIGDLENNENATLTIILGLPDTTP